MNTRFTVDGSDALEQRLTDLCDQVAHEVLNFIPPRKLQAIVLGGGYGRGEGGVMVTPAGDKPYNDLEFYLLLRGNEWLARRNYARRIHQFAEQLSHAAGVEIELKLLSFAKLRRSPVTMFYYDLIVGHRLVYGQDSWLTGCEHHRAAHRIPLHETTRLLMNRCSGLLYAHERLSRVPFTADDADFVGRNLAKAKLAFGDVILTMRGQYHWSCRERHKRLKKLAAENVRGNLSSLLPLHEQGLQFKLHPVRTERPQQELHAELAFLKDIGRDLWLDLETHRLPGPFRSIEEYSTDPASKCPETRPLKNCLINARTFGFSALRDTSYPRERLLRSLPLLLWAPPDHPLLPFIQRQLRTAVAEPRALVTAYEKLWRTYN
jgi:hypothetical protein